MQKHIPLIVGSLGVSTMTVAALLLVFVPDVEKTPLDGIHFSAPTMDASALEDDEILGAEFTSYQSDTFGYSVRYPSTWNLDDNRSTTTSDVLYAPKKEVIARINSAPLEPLTDMMQLEEKAAAIEDTLKNDPSFTIESIDHLAWNNNPVIRIEGVRKTESTSWKVTSISIFRLQRSDIFTMLFTREVKKNAEYKDAIEEIVKSLNPVIQ